MPLNWDAEQYLRYSNERNRALNDLLAQIPHIDPKIIYDLGCGPGNSTFVLQQRWPQARVIGVDNSTAMLAKARQTLPNSEWEQLDINHWRPSLPPDVVFSNAALQWLHNHSSLLPQLMSFLSKDGILAVQMPHNMDSPMYSALVATIQAGPWRKQLTPLLQNHPDSPTTPVKNLQSYYQLLSGLSKKLNMWETDYCHVLSGANAVVEWKKGTGLLAFLSALQESEKTDFLNIYNQHIQQYYPMQKDGHTLLTYRRLFMVAQK